ncbi:hypothetical protein E2C01_043951 [Portunus trituberculatus]|uniref:Uncharacterized protein n=1 Tax=Portunus trituberculatus TaxID=210409 RepID=A0A5B7FY44_PORTR|nr:hypothetical protein [Portunus trituberculatus]
MKKEQDCKFECPTVLRITSNNPHGDPEGAQGDPSSPTVVTGLPALALISPRVDLLIVLLSSPVPSSRPCLVLGSAVVRDGVRFFTPSVALLYSSYVCYPHLFSLS